MPEERLAADLAGATSRGELRAYYQPQLDLATGRIVAVEALARWHHPEHGTVPPDRFIPIAERFGVIREIGLGILDEASRQLATWHPDHPIQLAVNVSPLQVEDPEFSATVLGAAERHGLTPTALTVEITETRPILELAPTIAQLAALRDAGVGISIDDFDTGYSLSRIATLPATEVKLDHSLIQADDADRDRLAAMVAEARQSGLRVVAEGVETVEQLHLARAIGCHRAQGYLIAEPMTPEAIAPALDYRFS